MSEKANKKIRKEARGLFTKEVKQLAHSQALDAALRSFIKPKPALWPRWFYAFMLRKLISTGKK